MTQRNINYTALCALGLVLLLGGTTDVQAQTGREFQLHGFSSWGYGKTNGNLYLMGSDEGEYSNVASAISLSASPYENLAISSQVEWHIEGDEVEAELDYVFATLKVSDAFALNFGRVKHPFGIYTQIYDVGTLRPFFSLPQGIYGGSGFVAEGYNGVGISGASFGNSWGLTYDVYGGAINVLSESPFELFEEEEEEEEGRDDPSGGISWRSSR